MFYIFKALKYKHKYENNMCEPGFHKHKNKHKGIAKLGNIVVETLFLVMFPWVA